MQLITEAYRQLNKELHETRKNYGTVGKLYVSDVIKLCKMYCSTDVLDYGCGKNTLANNLPFMIRKYDPCIPEFDADPESADIVVCTDVAEHIEPELLDNVLQHIALLTKKACYMTCANVPARKELSDGRNAHLTVESPDWWENRLSKFFTVKKKHINVDPNDKNTIIQVVFVLEKKEHSDAAETGKQ